MTNIVVLFGSKCPVGSDDTYDMYYRPVRLHPLSSAMHSRGIESVYEKRASASLHLVSKCLTLTFNDTHSLSLTYSSPQSSE